MAALYSNIILFCTLLANNGLVTGNNFTENSIKLTLHYNSTENSIRWIHYNDDNKPTNLNNPPMVNNSKTSNFNSSETNDSGTNTLPTTKNTDRCNAIIYLTRKTVFMAVIWVGLLGNFLALGILSLQINNVSNMTLKVLAVVDSLYLLGYMVIIVMQHSEHLKHYAKTITFLSNVTRTVELMSIWMVVLLGFIRYIAICKPCYVKVFCTKTKVMLAIISLLACDVLLHIPIYLFNPKTLPWSSRAFNIVYLGITYYFLVRFAIPITSLLFMSVQLCRTTKMIHGRIQNSIHQGNKQELADVTRVIIAIIVVFLITNLPFVVFAILQIGLNVNKPLFARIVRDCRMMYFYKVFLQLMMIFNSSANFVVYFYLRKSFRTMLKDFLRRRSWSSRRTSASDNSVRTNSMNFQQLQLMETKNSA